MTVLIWNLALAVVWTFATGPFTVGNLLVGYVLGYFVLWLMHRGRPMPRYFARVRRILAFAIFFAYELVRANLRVARDIATPRLRTRPGVIAVPLDATTDSEITALANTITLTPGTLSLDISSDRRVLYLHAMFIRDPDAIRREIKDGFERRLLEIMR